MIFRKLYYCLKPAIPYAWRLSLRQWHARRQWQRHGSTWPVDERLGQPPPGWSGWPGGKRFALVLTHDVEGTVGLDQVFLAASLVERWGLQASFNLIPEGDYQVMPDLLHRLRESGHEVGVHDLHHDGRLFESRRAFNNASRRINHYLQAWNAVGFRGGFMLRNLDWIRDLEIAYDASTFDTDPFEPQPDGARTIFPFYVEPEGDRRGYAELPYTLVQDSTLFLYLQQDNIELWKRKLAWVAERGGLALLVCHPDYMQWGGQPVARGRYPARLYEEFLRHVRETYDGQFWSARPREMAEFVTENKACLGRTLRRGRPYRRVCFVGPLFYDSDNRTMRYAESLARRGDDVEVIAVRRPGESPVIQVNGVQVWRIRERQRNEKGRASYVVRLLSFCLHSAWFLTWRQFRAKYDLIHAHSIPDCQVFAALVPKLCGARVILDIYDVTPEFYLSKFQAAQDSPWYRAAILVERVSAHFADHVISANHLWHELLISRSVPRARCTPFVNSVDTRLFYPRSRARQDGRLVVVYPGILNWHQGVDIAVRAFRKVKDRLPAAEFHIYGDGNEKERLLHLIQDLGLRECVFIKNIVPLAEIPQIMADADLGVVAKRNDVFGSQAYSTKIMEYMTQGLPVVLSRTEIDAYYFNDSQVRFFEPENVDDMVAKMVEVLQTPGLRSTLVANAFRFVQQNSWATVSPQYLGLVDRLIRNGQG